MQRLDVVVIHRIGRSRMAPYRAYRIFCRGPFSELLWVQLAFLFVRMLL
jgi:hypothetical protein